MSKKDELAKIEDTSTDLAINNTPMGFEDEEDDDMIIPRVKVVNLLSPERKEGIAAEGDIINSLTKAKLNGLVFIPVFKTNSNILWRDRSEGGGIICAAKNGKQGVDSEGTCLLCKQCKKNEFDNTKQGKASYPTCTKYINFFGFISGTRIPIVLSFAKTNYKEGRTLFSLAKVTMENMWHNGYTLNSKLMKKADNEWYNIVAAANGAVSEEERAFGMALYTQFRNLDVQFDVEDYAATDTTSVKVTDADIESAEM